MTHKKRKRGRQISTSDVNYSLKHSDFDDEEIREWFEVVLKVGLSYPSTCIFSFLIRVI